MKKTTTGKEEYIVLTKQKRLLHDMLTEVQVYYIIRDCTPHNEPGAIKFLTWEIMPHLPCSVAKKHYWIEDTIHPP